jgi:hypothetical protein
MKHKLEKLRDSLAKQHGFGPLKKEELDYLKQFKGDDLRMTQELSQLSYLNGFNALLPLVLDIMEGMDEELKKTLLEQYGFQ